MQHYQFSIIEINNQFISAKNPLYNNTIKNIIEICQAIDKDASAKNPELIALAWKFIYNQA